MFASTVIGNGPASNPINVSTDQDSKCFFFLIKVLSINLFVVIEL